MLTNGPKEKKEDSNIKDENCGCVEEGILMLLGEGRIDVLDVNFCGVFLLTFGGFGLAEKNICERLGDLRRSDLRADVFMIN